MCYDNLKRKIRREVFTVEGPKPTKPKLDHIAAIKSQVNVQSDGESNSANDSQTLNSNYQISSDQWMLSDSASASSPQTCHSSTQNLDDECKEAPHRKEATSEEKLRRVLLSKEISLADLDLEMRSKKYELELKVEQAKLEYYRKKIALLDGSLQRTS
ncbi:unnamed protein product [Timema podura]|uniref:No apical meristem-associated C-terminal domain-containing protein n=1 Tax=Timema podura TaxID=61482 RepID=A0ABN7PF55_TIMPD|nr:unnamed protein product [Timema podura]